MPGLTLEPSQRELLGSRGDANVVPVSCALSADPETPISAYLRLRDLPGGFLFESVEGSARLARFSDDSFKGAATGRPVDGVQFHPESILTTAGKALLRNFLATAGNGKNGGA